jgi:hypothetical protein
LFLSSNVFAKDEKYAVEIKVDVSDENASLAREKALNSATRAAVNAIAKRLSTSDGAKKIANMTDAQIINFVKETSVINEKNSDVRYMAELKIVVNEELLKEYMKEREIPVISQIATNVLIIPVFREFTDDSPILWEANNLWKQAWDNSKDTSAIKFISVSQNPNYQSIIDAKQASAADYYALEALASASGIKNIYVLDASYKGVEGLNIIATSFSGDKFEFYVQGAKSSGDELFKKAVQQSRTEIEQHLLSNRADTQEIQNEVTILYHFPVLRYWIAAEQKIKNISAINNIQVQAMTPGKAQFKISYTGSLDTLQNQLKKIGYNLENAGTHMTLSDIGE